MSSLFLSDCYPALGGSLCGKSSLFPKHKRTLLVGKGPTLRLYAGALIERCFNAVLATHKGLIMPAEAMSFLFCSGSCKQSTRNFPHTCETSTGSNTVISRLASAVRNAAMEHLWTWTDYAEIARAPLPILEIRTPLALPVALVAGCCCQMFVVVRALLVPLFCHFLGLA